MSGEDLDELARAAELHDIGKIAIPEEILHKPGPLDPDEWAFVRRHTVIGERILGAAPALRPVAASCARPTSAGTAAATPTDWRATTSRSARGSSPSATPTRRWSPTGRTGPPCRRSCAVEELFANAGTQFDPKVVQIFSAALGERAPRASAAVKL